jgi:hypothetical protein
MKNLKKRGLLLLGIVFFALFLISNLTLVNLYLPNNWPHRYCADKCSFETHEMTKGHNPYGRVLQEFEDYKAEKDKRNLKLYRRFPIKWWQVWNWLDYLSHPRWRLPYAERDEDT